MLASRAVLEGAYRSLQSCLLPVQPLYPPLLFPPITPLLIPQSLVFSESPPGVGVGDASTTPTAALLLSVTQDTASRLATILFAARIGPALAPECKAYRLLADLFNDAATLLDLAAPLAPAGWARASVLSTAGVGRALCGVAAGGAKASLSAHFAGARGNVGDLNAKDASQETVIGLAGMLAGTLVVGRVTAPVTVWAAVVGLLAVHLAMNYRAVCAVRCRVLNRQRAGLVLSGLLAAPADAPRVAMTPAEVAVRERVLEMGGELRWCGGPALGRAEIGVPLARIVGAVGGAGKGGAEPRLSHLQDVMAGEGHMLWWDGRQERALLVLKQGVSAEGQLKAWAHALLVAREWSEGKADEKSRGPGEVLRLVTSTLEALNRRWAREVKEMRERGWDVDTASLETRPGTRVRTGER